MYLTDEVDVFYNSDEDTGAFKFDVDEATLSSASGDGTAVVVFTVSVGDLTVLVFSFARAIVPAGYETLTTLTMDGDATGLSGIVILGLVREALRF